MEAKDFKILLLAIDDKPDNLTTLRAILSGRLPAAKVLSALNGPKCIELARAEDPDVILLDIAMPGMAGFEVCRRLKADERLGSIPVLFLTAQRTDLDSRVKALEVGGDGFLSEPLNELELIAQIRAMAKIKAANRLQRPEKEQLATQTAAEAARASLEAQLRESQKMEALGTLAGGVAHDFNNILAVILSNVDLARREVGPGHAALESLGAIDKVSRRAKDLVRQILAFGRRQTLERKPTSLSLVVVESERLLRATLPAKTSLSVDCKADTPAVLADATQVMQTLLNLCNNAFQAVQNQGRPGVIEIRLTAHSTDGAPYNDGPERRSRGGRTPLRAGRYACLTVRDNGSGMDEATRARIFEPFFTTKSVGKGTGLGLSVVHSMVQAHEARIEVKSTPGEGSTFRIYFPAIDELVPEVSAPIPDITPVDGRSKHVLYVDDEEAIVFLVKRMLERQGFRVSAYTAPQEALAAARANPDQFDLVVTDYNMPGLSGLELAHALKEIRPDLPVVLASGYITEELRAKAPDAGIRELIYKPNTVEDLCEAVARLVQTAGRKSMPS